MKLEVLHQLGFRYQWNFQSWEHDHTADGAIFAPRYMERAVIDELEPRDVEPSIFDPQFFLPATPKGKLATYEFFPDVVSGGFSTDEFSSSDGMDESSALSSARGCVAFQVAKGFRYLIIPTRYLEGLPGDLIERQTRLFVEPFLKAVDQHLHHKPVLLQLILNDLMLKDKEYRDDLLNWVTGITDLAGVYLIVSPSKRNKQLKDMELLYAALQFIWGLSSNAMEVVVGYTNTEALLYSLASPKAVTIGCYENMRMFNIRTFQEDDDSEPRGPSPRLYVSRLLQWINANYIPFIQDDLKDDEQFFDVNEYQALMFKPTYNWHFTKPELYKHGMLEFSRQLRHVGEVEDRERFHRLSAAVNTAREWYARFEEAGIVFDPESDGSHLPPWLTVANRFAKDRGWR
ncbi:MAG TPA: hypothetical protein VF669_19955 [Tepidisphaeraceae bacterium]